MPWSALQQQAINTYNKNILVAAAAGSGKTSVLVERVIQRIVNKTCDINEILVVTFTNAAAAEMRERIANAITNQLSDKDKERQLVLLNAASISTLHAFCQNLIRQYFHQLGLDPKFRLGNPQEIDLLKYDVLEELFENNYDENNNEAFLEFTDTYGSERGDDSTYNIILKLYEYAQSQPFPKQWLETLPTYFQVKDLQDLDNCPWLQIIKQSIIDKLQIAQEITQKMYALATELKLKNYLDIATIDLDFLTELSSLAQSSWQELAITINDFKFKTMRAPKDTPEEIKLQFSSLRDEMKKIIKQLKETYFSQTLEETLHDMPKLYAQAQMLCHITIEFANKFAQAKAERSLIDFSDLEHFTLKLLAQEGSTADNLQPTNIAQTLQDKYIEIMVDEYQDTNGVQEAILKLIASPTTPNLFLVGDVKQSIYKFRLAEPELFLTKYKQYPLQENCMRIDLAQNFRSRKEILSGVNFIFSQIMTPQAGELSYGKDEALYCGFDYPANSNLTLKSPIELALFDKQQQISTNAENDEDSLQGFEAEAKYITLRIQELMTQQPLVFDKYTKNYRPIKYKDIVVLLRTVQDKAKILADTMRDNNIPVYASIESGYFQETEVRLMLSLLQIIDNPQQDIPLTAILYSPIFNFSIEDLAYLRLHKQNVNMYETLLSFVDTNSKKYASLRSKVNTFLTKLHRWRDYARNHSVPELIWLLLDETGYYDYVGGLPEGMVRQANLRALYDRANNYEQTSFRGLFRFLRFVQRMQRLGNDLAVARSLSDSEDVVRIMSIHKSKGLEFPIVILADTGKQFNLQDTQNSILFHKQLGLGLYVNDIKQHIRYQTLSRLAIAQQITNEYKAEEMRVLYVAMTRAREKLIITGSVRNIQKFAQMACSQVNSTQQTLPDYYILQAKSYLDWLGFALSRHHDGLLLRQYANVDNACILQDNSTWKLSLINDFSSSISCKTMTTQQEALFANIKKLQPLPETIYKQEVNDRLSWIYPHEEALSIPAKLSVTEIKQQFSSLLNAPKEDSPSLFEDISFKRPQFLQKQTKMTATEYGSLMHTVMQHLDFNGDLSDAGILKQLQQMATNEFIDSQIIHKIYRKNIRDFLNSPLGQRIQKASYLYRELAFNRMINAKIYYPQADKNDTIFIQGIIDLLFEEKDQLILLDYKTDNCTEQEAKIKYQLQIELYAQAASEIMRKPVSEKYLYLFHKSCLIKM